MVAQPSDSILSGQADLTSCDQEPIHIPGNIQDHGILVSLREPDLAVVQISSNLKARTNLTMEQVLEQPLGHLLDRGSETLVRQAVAELSVEGTPTYLSRLRTAGEVREWEAIIHRHDGVIILQLEQAEPAERSTFSLYARLQATLTQLSRSGSVQTFCQTAAEQVRRFTGFDRVMIYRFLADQSGQVIAESRRDDLEPFLGLHFPASDIPKQARELYLKSWLRFIVDTESEPVALLPTINPVTQRPLDMSFAVLRSVSPVHLEYLRNMNVRASLSISIVRDGRLWGLVACHHLSPKLIPHAQRMVCEMLAHTLSLQMGSIESQEDQDYNARMWRVREALLERMAHSEPFYAALTDLELNALHCLDATGVALSIDGEIKLLGRTPGLKQVTELFEWLGRTAEEPVFSSDQLNLVYAPADQFQDSAAGILGMRLARNRPEFLVWFRPAVRQLVTWGGNPDKPVEDGRDGFRLSPRKSFSAWQQTVEGKSLPWRDCEIQAAAELRRGIVEIILHKAEELARLNEELKKSNIELDSFAYVASHDLKEPLRGIHNYSQILKRTLGDRLQAGEQGRIDTILRLTQRMDDLIESLLQYSRAGRMELQLQPNDLGDIARQVLTMLTSRIDSAGARVSVRDNMAVVLCDRVRVSEIFSNLITNALKYNDKDQKVVEIGYVEGTFPRTFYVRDNGIGIDPEFQEEIFLIFKRLHGRDEFGGGNGAGLTITRKMVERHGGKIWIESVPGEGSTFLFTLEKEPS